MKRELPLADIQGNIINGYSRSGMPKARHFFLHINDPRGGRRFVETVIPRVTTSVRWGPDAQSAGPAGAAVTARPKVTLNIGFTFFGLYALGLPTITLREMPAEFIDGMAKRARLLGDREESAPQNWDPIWRNPAKAVHAWIAMNAQMDPETGRPVPELEQQTEWVRGLCGPDSGVELLRGHDPDEADYQEASALLMRDSAGFKALPTEHFGFTDGIGNPVFAGQLETREEGRSIIGAGKQLPDGSWRPLATGEFLLGYSDESQETPPAPLPVEFARNCTFMVYRKLHQNVASFRGYIADIAHRYARDSGDPAGSDPNRAAEIVKAKMVGRWSNGVPLMAAPTYDDWIRFRAREQEARRTKDNATLVALQRQINDFRYRDDPEGLKCPLTSHIRRSNTRDMLDPEIGANDPKASTGSSLNDRRRILRRGLPYGASRPEDGGDDADSGNHGIIFIGVCASLFRQFEFVQQQWIQYGLDLNAGNDTCPLAGNHGKDAKFVIPVDPGSGRAPFICSGIPQFVTTRGGDYFFVPSLTALRMIAMGTIDPT